MVTKTCQYETEDGSVFENFSSALEHDIEVQLTSFITDLGISMEPYEIKTLANNYSVLYDIIQDHMTQLESKEYKDEQERTRAGY